MKIVHSEFIHAIFFSCTIFQFLAHCDYKDQVENESEEMEKKEPNNSLISSLVTHKEGDRLSRRGYWGDIVTGPFIPFGHEYKKEVSSIIYIVL